jgi:hypothetical protein
VVLEGLLTRCAALKTLSESPGRSDKDIFEEFEKLVLDAGNHDRDHVEIPLGLALNIQFMLQARFRRRRGRVTKPAHDVIAEKTVIMLARLRKTELIEAGAKAGEAGREAAEDAANRLGRYGINIAATTIFRRMQTTGK